MCKQVIQKIPLVVSPVSTWRPDFFMSGSWNPCHCNGRYRALGKFSEEWKQGRVTCVLITRIGRYGETELMVEGI